MTWLVWRQYRAQGAIASVLLRSKSATAPTSESVPIKFGVPASKRIASVVKGCQ